MYRVYIPSGTGEHERCKYDDWKTGTCIATCSKDDDGKVITGTQIDRRNYISKSGFDETLCKIGTNTHPGEMRTVTCEYQCPSSALCQYGEWSKPGACDAESMCKDNRNAGKEVKGTVTRTREFLHYGEKNKPAANPPQNVKLFCAPGAIETNECTLRCAPAFNVLGKQDATKADSYARNIINRDEDMNFLQQQIHKNGFQNVCLDLLCPKDDTKCRSQRQATNDENPQFEPCWDAIAMADSKNCRGLSDTRLQVCRDIMDVANVIYFSGNCNKSNCRMDLKTGSATGIAGRMQAKYLADMIKQDKRSAKTIIESSDKFKFGGNNLRRMTCNLQAYNSGDANIKCDTSAGIQR